MGLQTLASWSDTKFLMAACFSIMFMCVIGFTQESIASEQSVIESHFQTPKFGCQSSAADSLLASSLSPSPPLARALLKFYIISTSTRRSEEEEREKEGACHIWRLLMLQSTF